MDSTPRYHSLRKRVHDLLGGKCAKCGDSFNRIWIDRIKGENGKRGLNLFYEVLKHPEDFRLLCVHHKLLKKKQEKKPDYGWPKWDPFHGEESSI